MLDLQIRTCTGRLSTGSSTLLSVPEKNCVSFQKTKMHDPGPAVDTTPNQFYESVLDGEV